MKYEYAWTDEYAWRPTNVEVDKSYWLDLGLIVVHKSGSKNVWIVIRRKEK